MPRLQAALLCALVAWGCAEARLPDPVDEPRFVVPSQGPNPASNSGAQAAPVLAPTPHRDDEPTGAPQPTEPTPEDAPRNPEPVCEDHLAGTGLAAGPAGLMIQVPSITDTCALQRALDHVCREHQEDIHDLVLTSVETWSGGEVRPELDTRVLDAIEPYLDCFDNVFVGTISEIMLDDPYAPATINDPDARWRWLVAAKDVAAQMAAWMNANTSRAWHWYVSYEANLNAFTDTAYRNAYVALLQQHIADISALNPGVVAWSPTFWTAPVELNPGERASLASALTDVFDRVPVDWVLIQDHLGARPDWACGDALTYYEMVRAAAPNVASVQLNVEYFTLREGSVLPGDADEIAARVECYRAAGASLGASFEARYWYTGHGH